MPGMVPEKENFNQKNIYPEYNPEPMVQAPPPRKLSLAERAAQAKQKELAA